MNSIQAQGLMVATLLIGCAVSAVALCVKVLPSPAESHLAPEQADLKRLNSLVLGWVVLACIIIVTGHLIAYYMLGPRPVC
ncbi:hypothetical protein [Ralstonia pseudosolanacearum]|uniref:hypothetical protein n=1 Tax=Ralstonia pseudosolanacearum TaxID=1310165 RepID=UPI001FF9F4F2|nr:hypothetical protein [Ralstonia pseudosolanacearum]